MTPENSPAPALIAMLASSAATQEKARACQQLALVGGADAVPSLAALLADEKLADYARCALEGIDAPAATAVLRDALSRLEGRPLAGAIDSLGVRRDGAAVATLETLATDLRRGVGPEALAALGKIATDRARVIIIEVLIGGPPEMRLSAAHAALAAASQKIREGHRDTALPLLQSLASSSAPASLRAAARTLSTTSK